MAKPARWLDTLSFVFSLVVVFIAVGWLWRNGTFDFKIHEDEKRVWHLIRSSGITAYILLTISVVWGLALSSRVVKDWSPGVLSMLLHSGISWLAVIFSAAHAALLMFDDYFTYQITDLVIPFTGPYRPLAVGLGTLSFWIILIVTLSFSVKKRLGRKLWKNIHLLSYLGFWMVTAHGLFAGTDRNHLGFQILLAGSVLLTVLLLGYRLRTGGSKKTPTSKKQSSRAAAAKSAA